MGTAEVKHFVDHFVVHKKVLANMQSLALNALVFLYDQLLETPFGDLGHFAHSMRPKRLPVVLSRSEVVGFLGLLYHALQETVGHIRIAAPEQ